MNTNRLRELAEDLHSATGYNPVAAALSQAADEIERTRAEAEALRHGWITLQIAIGDLIPAVDGERANDPMIRRVERICTEVERLRGELTSHPSEAMIKAGSDMASLLMDVSVAFCMDGLGGSITSKEWETIDVPNKDLAERYAKEEIDSVAAIYIAMRRATTEGEEEKV